MDNQQHNIILYQTDSTIKSVSACHAQETFWMTRKTLCELYGCTIDNISIIEQELNESVTAEFFSVAQNEGMREVSRKIKFFNHDAVIAVGYRVNFKQAAAFRF